MSPTVYNRLLLVLSYAGIFVAGVLSLAAIANKDVPCGPSHGCAIVAADPSSHLFGFPNAYLGFAAYIFLAVLASYRELAGIGNSIGRISVYIGYGCAAVGTFASVYLTYISITQIHAECFWCLTSAAVMTLTLFVYMFLANGVDSAPTEPTPGNLRVILVPVLAIGSVAGIVATMVGMHASGEKDFPATEVIRKELAGPGDNILNPNGVVTVVEFGDLDCPNCRHLYPQIEQLVNNSNGKVRLVFHNFPLYMNPQHTGALPGAIIAEMAAENGKFWDYIALAYGNSQDPHASDPGPDDMITYGTKVGLDRDTINRRLQDKNDPALKIVLDDLELARVFKVEQTPTFIVMTGDKEDNAVQVAGSAVFDVLEEPKFKNLLAVK